MRKIVSLMLCLSLVFSCSSFGMRNQRQRERTVSKKPWILRDHGKGVVIGIAAITLIGSFAKTNKMGVGGKIWNPLEKWVVQKNEETALAVLGVFKRFLLEVGSVCSYCRKKPRLAYVRSSASAAPQRIGPKTVEEWWASTAKSTAKSPREDNEKGPVRQNGAHAGTRD